MSTTTSTDQLPALANLSPQVLEFGHGLSNATITVRGAVTPSDVTAAVTEIQTLGFVRSVSTKLTQDALLLMVDFNGDGRRDYGYGLTETQRDRFAALVAPEFFGTLSASAKVIRDDQRRHIGTIVTLQGNGLATEVELPKVRGVQRIRWEYGSVVFSMGTPSHQVQDVSDLATAVANALGYQVSSPYIEDNTHAALLPDLDWRPATVRRNGGSKS